MPDVNDRSAPAQENDDVSAVLYEVEFVSGESLGGIRAAWNGP